MTEPACSSLPGLPVVELTLPNLPGYEKVARDVAASLAGQMGFSQDRVEDLKTAVAEACMNAAEHGNGGDTTSQVRVFLRVEEKALQVCVQDRGASPLPDPLPEPGLPDRTHGWGLFFISALVDEVAFDQLPDGGNRVCMVIRLQGREPAPVQADAAAAAEAAQADTDAAAPGEPQTPDAAAPPQDDAGEHIEQPR